MRKQRDLSEIDYFPVRFIIHLALMAVSIAVLMPLAFWLSGGNPWVRLLLWLPAWFITAPLRLFLISLILAIWDEVSP